MTKQRIRNACRPLKQRSCLGLTDESSLRERHHLQTRRAALLGQGQVAHGRSRPTTKASTLGLDPKHLQMPLVVKSNGPALRRLPDFKNGSVGMVFSCLTRDL